jgi:hypothetical protein
MDHQPECAVVVGLKFSEVIASTERSELLTTVVAPFGFKLWTRE